MADWYGAARSNYFRVKDLDAFKAAMEKLDIAVWGQGPSNEIRDDGLVMVTPQGSDKGDWPSSLYNEDTDEYEDVDVADLIAQHLADDEVAILMECGAEKLRYLTGWALAINKGDTRRVSLDDIYPLASQLGENVTEASC